MKITNIKKTFNEKTFVPEISFNISLSGEQIQDMLNINRKHIIEIIGTEILNRLEKEFLNESHI